MSPRPPAGLEPLDAPDRGVVLKRVAQGRQVEFHNSISTFTCPLERPFPARIRESAYGETAEPSPHRALPVPHRIAPDSMIVYSC